MRQEYGFISHPPWPFLPISFAVREDLHVSIYKVPQCLIGEEGENCGGTSTVIRSSL